MRKKLKALVAMMSLCALGTVGSAFALTRNAATGTGTAGQFEQAIHLYWGGTNSSVELADCDELSAGVAVYRYLTVSPQSTKTVAGTVTVGFELEVSGGEFHLEGVTVTVYRADVEINAENIETYATDTYKKGTLTKSALTYNDTFDVAASASKHTTAKYYAIQVLWSGANDTSHPTYQLGGSLDISQTFAPTAA